MHQQSNAQPAYKASDDIPESYPGPYAVFPILLPRRQQRAILFALGMKRHGQPAYWLRSQSYGQVLAWLSEKVAAEERFDLPEKDLLGIAKRITAYCLENLLSERTQAGFVLSQSNKGQLSGKARRAATAERDAAILRYVQDGGTISGAARAFGRARSTVRNILQRDRFKGGDEPKSQGGDEPKPFKRNKTWSTGDKISEQERRGRMRGVEGLKDVESVPAVERTPSAEGQMMLALDLNFRAAGSSVEPTEKGKRWAL